ncbi:diacylglycerol O-acyltransferase 1 isoform X2 [Cornus florida]|uniref:diacylglycerol O-acyltransferase 1 isoform X2 n=1 Tax=Cornus florida TaxID=4283 RepID=UPI002898B831|nr:diacylglycerol O-acyltransferase 1 isoform X2 [Cornus florida]
MAILDSPESTGTSTSIAQDDSDLNLSVRRRPSVSTVRAESDSTSETNSFEAESSTKDFENGQNQIADGGGPVESANELCNGKDGGDKVGNGENRGTDFLAKLAYRPSVPAHRRIKESPLSSDAIFKQSHAGLFNLCIVVLVAVNSRLIIENLMKYGWLIQTGFWFSSRSLRDWPLLMCCLTLPVFPFAAFVVEKLVQQKCISEPVVVGLHILITTAAVLFPVLMILRFDSAVLSGVTLMLFACIVWLKLVSYAHTNYDMRALAKSLDKGEVLSISSNIDCSFNVSFESLVYFMVAPTLCYQPSYPRTSCVRKGWVARQLVKLVIFTGVMGFIVEQYINPIVKNSQHPLKGNLLYAIERVLKLSVPNLYVWLCMFYCFFHLWLNILAELLCFGDREFYKDWWNAKTVEEYWRMWNMPVHKWMVRHIYFPCLRHGIPKGIAVLIAFLVSAIFHEVHVQPKVSDAYPIPIPMFKYCVYDTAMYCCSLPHIQVLGFFWNYVSGTFGHGHKVPAR